LAAGGVRGQSSVYYFTSASMWIITNLDGGATPSNASSNVLVIKKG
jgi:hypothetical protein